MSKYVCPDCNKDFKQKINFINHTEKKKKPCKETINLPITKTIEKSIIDNKNKIPSQIPSFSSQNPSFSSQSPSFSSQNPSQIKNNKNTDVIYTCDYCDNLFNRSDNLKRHIEKFCKNKKHFDNVDVIKSKFNNTIIISSDKYEKLLEDNSKLIEMLEDYKQYIKENNLIKQSIPNTINNINNIIDNSTKNSNVINNGLVNNGTISTGNTINIVQFGKEDISKCNLIEMMSIYLKSTGGNIFSNMLKYLNFNPNYPENFNILMSDLSREIVKIHNGKKFISKKFKNVKNDILNVLNEHITNMCYTYIEDSNTKKNDDILSKIKINDISVKLINNDDITPLLKNKDEINDESDNDDLDLEGQRKLTHYENKRLGLQEITMQKLKEELYNNRTLIK